MPICNTCGEQLGLNSDGEVFVACHECHYPVCKSCFEYEIKEGRASCLRCGTPYDGIHDVNFFNYFAFPFVIFNVLINVFEKLRLRELEHIRE